jgi:hypothetical protein
MSGCVPSDRPGLTWPRVSFVAIREEGEAMAARADILILGTERLGSPPEAVPAQLNLITDLQRLTRILLRTITAATWQEIIETP